MDIDVERTNEINEYITTILDELVRENRSNITIEINEYNTNINDYLENVLINNMFGNNLDTILTNSFEEDKGLEKDDNVKITNCTKYEGDNSVECSICMDDENKIVNGSDIYTCNKCNKVFHKSCMGEWVKMKIECPLCRCSLDEDINYVDSFEEWIKSNIDI